MSTPATARAAVLDVLNLLDEVRQRIARAPVGRGKSNRLEVWRAVLADRSADAFPRRLAASVRTAKGLVGPLRESLRTTRPDGPYPTGSVVHATTATEYVLAVAEEIGIRLADGLPSAAARSWIADDEVKALGDRIEPLLAALPEDLADQIFVEFAGLSGK